MLIDTVYVHPGFSQCRIYAIPKVFKGREEPRKVPVEDQGDWREIGLMNARGELVYCEPEYRKQIEEVSLYGGVYFTVQLED